ncbi:chymotrypsinogen A isoform X2 [Nomia melanderi]|uniref:chymotrypsinogen A isoform X2 n=1 Tax=Nomia melanderi TaxID=2448451 RepID=UPI0013046E5E|nr:chymotrypsinogen A-like isoform X2 [Nomia melanderi]
MTSANVKSVSFVVVALTVVGSVLCSPLLIGSALVVKPNAPSSSLSGNQSSSDLGHFPGAEEDDADTDRIVGGRYARRHQFPFMAVVHRLLGGGYVAQCGGTIISQRWVLTAGHCVSQDPPRRFIVVFGVNDKSGLGYDFYQGSGVAMMTERGALHPGYRPSVNDVGLLYMPRDIPFGRNIQPIRLAGPSQAYEDFAGMKATVIGWGKDQSTGVGTKYLKYATLPIISSSQCSIYWNIIPKKHVCTVAGYGSDACQGDSGGPLIVYKNGAPLQIGVVSYGDANCPSSRPGVFSRVTGYIDWIQQVTGLYYGDQ